MANSSSTSSSTSSFQPNSDEAGESLSSFPDELLLLILSHTHGDRIGAPHFDYIPPSLPNRLRSGPPSVADTPLCKLIDAEIDAFRLIYCSAELRSKLAPDFFKDRTIAVHVDGFGISLCGRHVPIGLIDDDKLIGHPVIDDALQHVQHLDVCISVRQFFHYNAQDALDLFTRSGEDLEPLPEKVMLALDLEPKLIKNSLKRLVARLRSRQNPLVSLNIDVVWGDGSHLAKVVGNSEWGLWEFRNTWGYHDVDNIDDLNFYLAPLRGLSGITTVTLGEEIECLNLAQYVVDGHKSARNGEPFVYNMDNPLPRQWVRNAKWEEATREWFNWVSDLKDAITRSVTADDEGGRRR